MKKLLLLIISFSALIYSQGDLQIKVADAVKSLNYNDWGIDNAIINNEPIGGFSGVQKSNGTLYVAINDTLSTVNLGLVILTSTDGGDTWSLFGQGINYRGYYPKIKMIRSGLDSIYCTFQIGTGIYTWNPLSGNFGSVFVGNYRTYDMVASSTGNLYVFLDSLPNNSIIRYGSTTGGRNWITRGNVTSNGAMPKVFMSGSGDTLTLNYYGPVLFDTTSSVVRAARYRETGSGTLASIAFIDVITGNDYKQEFKTVMNKSECWLFYTLGDGDKDIWARKSSNNGLTYDSPILIAGNPNRYEYGFDATFYNGAGSSGFDLVYYSDSAQVGQPTNDTDILFYKSVNFGSTTFSPSERISENPPGYPSSYLTSIMAMPYSGADVAALWVGDASGTKKLFFDKLSAIIPVELTSFTANVSRNNVTLNWTTATETNNSGFTIERSQTEAGWVEVGFVPGFGTTTELRSYSYTDAGLSSGTYFYRIKQIDYNGTFTYYNLASLVEVSTPDVFELTQNYPNPFNPTTAINYSIAKTTNVQLVIFNSIGEEIAVMVNETQQPGRYSVNFDAASLSSGVYFYKLVAGDFVSIKKMLLLK
ncbi:MAG: T9SS type A sorting domain-containing protein [Ignavibacteriaceae bacterium]|nr:T9SS type A sorting domain-containing protein [Ignavibacteriaceae bacterium]